MNITDFKASVAAWVSRDASSFVYGTVDVLLDAINDAKRDAQMDFDFAGAVGECYISAGPSGAELSTATTAINGGGSAVLVNKVRSLWILDDNGNKAYSIPIQYDTILDRLLPADPYPTATVRAYITGTKLFVTGVNDGTAFKLGVVKWIPDYSVSVTTDFFLDYYRGWLLLATIRRLNLHLKEDNRVSISQATYDEAWQKVLRRENSIAPNYGND